MTRMVFGPLALLAIAAGLAARKHAWFSGLSVAFVVVIGLMILGRWVEQRSGAATTITGKPATAEQCTRYSATLVIVGAVIWAAANVLGSYILA